MIRRKIAGQMKRDPSYYYEVLELVPGATLVQVKEQWRVLSQIWHPDKQTVGSKAHEFALKRQQEINEAYEELTKLLEDAEVRMSRDVLWQQANQGDEEAQFKLGVQFEKGKGRARDQKEAENWILKAALQGHLKAQFHLGYMYFSGGIKQDYDEALTWWVLAGKAGHVKAQFNLGLMYETGKGVPKDLVQALAWYELAAEQGDLEATNKVRGIQQAKKADAHGAPPAGNVPKGGSTPWWVNSDGHKDEAKSADWWAKKEGEAGGAKSSTGQSKSGTGSNQSSGSGSSNSSSNSSNTSSSSNTSTAGSSSSGGATNSRTGQRSKAKGANANPRQMSQNEVNDWARDLAYRIDAVLVGYDIEAHPIDWHLTEIGPSVIRLKLRLQAGEKMNKLRRAAEDIGRELSLQNTPLIDNLPGTHYVSFDVPHPSPSKYPLEDSLRSLTRQKSGELPIIIGKSPSGDVVIEDLSEFPHLLVAGSTNSGKSVFLRSLVLCLMQTHTAGELQILIIDPKRTDFVFFQQIPHLLKGQVITEPKQATDAIWHLVRAEMPRRQRLIAGRSLRLKDFNQRFPQEALPPIVAIVDEYAQLIAMLGRRERAEFEQELMSFAAVARSVGIHLVVATQRPSSDVVTPVLKANLPVAISFKVATAVNSRVILDQSGAENLLGSGDLLMRASGGNVMRIQAAYVDEAALPGLIQQCT